jgi:Na+/alanine symporter
MKKLTYLFAFLLMTLLSVAVHAQDKSAIGETMRSNGRIYVVIAVMVTILTGLIIYLIRLDRKISKLEKS